MLYASGDWDRQQLVRLAERHGTPLYVYDMDRLRETIDRISGILEPLEGQLYFATMANDRPRVLRYLAERGVGACVNSLPHLALALQSGFPVQAIQFTSTGISRSDLQDLATVGLQLNCDSIAQLRAWCEVGGGDPGLRINAGALTSGGNADRIGMSPTDLPATLEVAARYGRKIAGLHVYVGTNFQSPSEMAPALTAFFALAATVPSLEYVNIGGGIGIDYSGETAGFDLAAFGQIIHRLAVELRRALSRRVEVILEPGRSIAAPCGAFVTRVTDDKHLGDTRYLATDASIAIFPRPFHHPESPHRIVRLTADSGDDVVGSPALVVGRTTFSRDIIGRVPAPPQSQIDELLMMGNAGAYSQSMASAFLGQPQPTEVYLDGTEQMQVAAE